MCTLRHMYILAAWVSRHVHVGSLGEPLPFATPLNLASCNVRTLSHPTRTSDFGSAAMPAGPRTMCQVVDCTEWVRVSPPLERTPNKDAKREQQARTDSSLQWQSHLNSIWRLERRDIPHFPSTHTIRPVATSSTHTTRPAATSWVSARPVCQPVLCLHSHPAQVAIIPLRAPPPTRLRPFRVRKLSDTKRFLVGLAGELRAGRTFAPSGKRLPSC